MMEIVKGRTWTQYLTVMDTEDGPLTDLTQFDTIRSDIREKTATRNAAGYFECVLVASVGVEFDEFGVLTLTLPRSITKDLHVGAYLIDVVGSNDDGDETILDQEPIRVAIRPTDPDGTAVDFPTIPGVEVPDTVAILNQALED